MLSVPVLAKIDQLPVPPMVRSYLRLADLMGSGESGSGQMGGYHNPGEYEDGREYDPHDTPRSGHSLSREASTITSDPNVSDIE